MNVVLISTYELGHQPFGLASPAAWLRSEGFNVACADLVAEPLPEDDLREADLIAFYIPMHTATRLAVKLLERVKPLNPTAHLCFYGLYAPMNAAYLRRMGAGAILGGEFESGLVNLCKRLERKEEVHAREGQPEPGISLTRQKFRVPDRRGLPPLSRYARLSMSEYPALVKVTGYVEASRGCKHLCRHCPIVPVYQGRFRIVQKEIVLADIRQQVAAGAEHVTFGDPDFFNGIGHTIPIIQAMHAEFPDLTYDVTIKVEHLLKHAEYLPVLKETGCLIVTTAVESIDDRVLAIFDKGHTREDFVRVVKLFREVGLTLNPTFVPFTPWTTLEGYRKLLSVVNELGLVQQVAPVQLAIRLLIPAGSKLLELSEVQSLIEPFNDELLMHEWTHPDLRVDLLHEEVTAVVHSGISRKATRRAIFSAVWESVNRALDLLEPLPSLQDVPPRTAVPFLNEPWYC